MTNHANSQAATGSALCWCGGDLLPAFKPFVSLAVGSSISAAVFTGQGPKHSLCAGVSICSAMRSVKMAALFTFNLGRLAALAGDSSDGAFLLPWRVGERIGGPLLNLLTG